MSLSVVMASLESAGSEQNRKIYARHGVRSPAFGVSFAHLKTLQKTYKKQTALALELWYTGNHDARMLATQIADPQAMTVEQLEKWLEVLDNYVLTDQVAQLLSGRKDVMTWIERLKPESRDWWGQVGYDLLAKVAMNDPHLPDSYFLEQLEEIRTTLHQRNNRTRHAMNQAMIAIGIRNPALKEVAWAVAGVVGKVEVDHGETGCETPDARAYIEKTFARREAQAAKKGKA